MCELCAESNRFLSFDPTVTSSQQRDENDGAMPCPRLMLLHPCSRIETANTQPGVMMGPGMTRYGRVDLMCSPAAAGFVGWRIDRLELFIKPTEAQRGKFDKLKAASNNAMRVACPTDAAATATGRMEAMEKRLDAMLQAVKTIRPPLEAFVTLSDEQEARPDAPPGRMRFWRELW